MTEDRTLVGATPIAGRPRLAEEVAARLREALIRGDFKLGDRLRIENLSKSFGVSTMPVREALMMLVPEGLVEMVPRRGFRASPPTNNDLQDIFELDAVLARMLTEKATKSITPMAIEALKRIQAEVERLSRVRMSRAEKMVQIDLQNFHFHHTVNLASRPTMLLAFVRRASSFVPRAFYCSIPGWMEATIDDHPAIIAALAKHDQQKAGQLMYDHVRRNGKTVLEYMVQQDLRRA